MTNLSLLKAFVHYHYYLFQRDNNIMIIIDENNCCTTCISFTEITISEKYIVDL